MATILKLIFLVFSVVINLLIILALTGSPITEEHAYDSFLDARIGYKHFLPDECKYCNPNRPELDIVK